VDPVPDPLLLRKSGSAGDRTRDLCICSQKLWPLDHRGGRRVEVEIYLFLNSVLNGRDWSVSLPPLPPGSVGAELALEPGWKICSWEKYLASASNQTTIPRTSIPYPGNSNNSANPTEWDGRWIRMRNAWRKILSESCFEVVPPGSGPRTEKKLLTAC